VTERGSEMEMGWVKETERGSEMEMGWEMAWG
jgi:hypothetical protein